jgi:hypothetical protein
MNKSAFSFRVSTLLIMLIGHFFAVEASADASGEVKYQIYADLEKPSLAAAATQLPPLYLARGEYSGFSLRIPAGTGHAIENPRFEFKSSRDAKLPSLDVKVYLEAGHDFHQSSFRSKNSGFVEDILIPNDLFRQPGFHFPVENKAPQPTYLIEVHVPLDSEVGDFKGQFRFELDAKEYSLPIEGHISSYVLPSQFRLKTSFGFAPNAVIQKHLGSWTDQSHHVVSDYLNLAREHRIDFHKMYVSFPVLDTLATHPIDLLSPHQGDMSFINLWSGVSSEKLDQRFSGTDLPVPSEMKQLGKNAQATKRLKLFWQSLDKSVSQKTESQNFYVYFADEPARPMIPKLASALKQIKLWAPHLKFLVVSDFEKPLAANVDIWCVNLMHWNKSGFASPAFYRQLQVDEHKQLWFYVSCNAHGCSSPEENETPDFATDRPSAYVRALPWFAFKYNADGVLYYDTVFGYTKSPAKSPWVDSFAFTGYGEGNLFYPCTLELCGVSAALPSLRLKILRSGLQDVEILRAALLLPLQKSGQEKQSELRARVDSLFSRSQNFPHRTEIFEQLKVDALKILDAN